MSTIELAAPLALKALASVATFYLGTWEAWPLRSRITVTAPDGAMPVAQRKKV